VDLLPVELEFVRFEGFGGFSIGKASYFMDTWEYTTTKVEIGAS
jgi:hypothetical protein